MIAQKNWVGFHPPKKKKQPFFVAQTWMVSPPRPIRARIWTFARAKGGKNFGGKPKKKPVSYIKMWSFKKKHTCFSKETKKIWILCCADSTIWWFACCNSSKGRLKKLRFAKLDRNIQRFSRWMAGSLKKNVISIFTQKKLQFFGWIFHLFLFGGCNFHNFQSV